MRTLERMLEVSEVPYRKHYDMRNELQRTFDALSQELQDQRSAAERKAQELEAQRARRAVLEHEHRIRFDAQSRDEDKKLKEQSERYRAAPEHARAQSDEAETLFQSLSAAK